MIDRTAYDLFSSSLFTLPEDIYFSLLRGFLGTIPTPFNKHQLNRTLASRISRNEHQSEIVSHLGTIERELVSALTILHSVSEQDLLYLCTVRHGFHECLHGALLLEQKLIVIPDPHLSHMLIINPLFRERLSEVIDHRLLFGFDDHAGSRYAFSDDVHLIYRALLSYSIHCENSTMSLPDTWEEHRAVFDRIPAFLTGRSGTGAMDLTEQRETTRESVAWALLHAGLSDRFTLEKTGLFISGLRTLSETFEVRGESGALTLVRFAQSLASMKEIDTGTLRSLLSALSIISENDEKAPARHPGTADTIDSDHSITIHRGNPSVPTGRYHLYSRLTGLDATIRYTIDKKSLFKAFSRSFSPQDIVSDMKHSFSRVPSSILSLIPLLYQEFTQVMEIRGIVLKTDARMERIFDAHASLAPFIEMKIANGVYVMNQEHQAQWRRILSEIGVQHIADLKTSQDLVLHRDLPGMQHLPDFAFEPPVITVGKPAQQPERGTAPDLRPHLHEVLTRKPFSEDVKALLGTRIDDFIIVSEQQLHPTGEEQKILSAGGLDYMKKLRVIRAAMKDGSLHLLVTFLDGEGTTVEYIGTPLSLTRKDDEDILVLRTHPEEKEQHWKVRSLFKVKTVPLSFFFADKRDR